MYRHQFTLKGTYHIWSGQVTDFRSYRGKVIVVDKQSSAEQITVKVAGQEAIYDNSGEFSFFFIFVFFVFLPFVGVGPMFFGEAR